MFPTTTISVWDGFWNIIVSVLFVVLSKIAGGASLTIAERLWNYIDKYWPANVIRSKGLFWIASRPDFALNWSQAGGSLRSESAGNWWASMPMQKRLQYQDFVDNKQTITEKWDDDFGDRQNELVIIGQDLDTPQICRELEDCICTPKEIMKFMNGGNFKDPFPEM